MEISEKIRTETTGFTHQDIAYVPIDRDDRVWLLAMGNAEMKSKLDMEKIKVDSSIHIWSTPENINESILSHVIDRIKTPTNRGQFELREINTKNIEKVLKHACSMMKTPAREFMEEGLLLIIKQKNKEDVRSSK